MKRALYFLAAAAALVLTASCQKEESIINVEEPQQQEEAINVAQVTPEEIAALNGAEDIWGLDPEDFPFTRIFYFLESLRYNWPLIVRGMTVEAAQAFAGLVYALAGEVYDQLPHDGSYNFGHEGYHNLFSLPEGVMYSENLFNVIGQWTSYIDNGKWIASEDGTLTYSDMISATNTDSKFGIEVLIKGKKDIDGIESIKNSGNKIVKLTFYPDKLNENNNVSVAIAVSDFSILQGLSASVYDYKVIVAEDNQPVLIASNTKSTQRTYPVPGDLGIHLEEINSIWVPGFYIQSSNNGVKVVKYSPDDVTDVRFDATIDAANSTAARILTAQVLLASEFGAPRLYCETLSQLWNTIVTNNEFNFYSTWRQAFIPTYETYTKGAKATGRLGITEYIWSDTSIDGEIVETIKWKPAMQLVFDGITPEPYRVLLSDIINPEPSFWNTFWQNVYSVPFISEN